MFFKSSQGLAYNAGSQEVYVSIYMTVAGTHSTQCNFCPVTQTAKEILT